MTRLSRTLAAFILSIIALTSFAGGGFEDDFSDPEKEGRKALRGEWKFENNTASCIADPELYKKFKDHGPILRWPIEMTDGEIEFEFKTDGCQNVVITLNEAGHVFRVILMDGKKEKVKSRAIAWAGPSKTTDSEKVSKSVIPTLASLGDGWVKARLVFKDGVATISIGDYTEAITHSAAARPKKEFTLGFTSGRLAMRGVKVTATSGAPTGQ